MPAISVAHGAEAGGLGIQGLPGLQGEFYTGVQNPYRFCFNVKNIKTGDAT